MDTGSPWGGPGDLPPALALWLIGAGVRVVWNPPRTPQKNGKVERCQGVAQAWAEPGECADLGQLRERLHSVCRLQRERYPAVHGRSRIEAYPKLKEGGRPYDPADWSLDRVAQTLAQGRFVRRVDKAGQISLHRHTYRVGRQHAGKEVSVRFDAPRREWVIEDDRGEEVARRPSVEITPEAILALEVSHKDPSDLRRQRKGPAKPSGASPPALPCSA